MWNVLLYEHPVWEDEECKGKDYKERKTNT